jgi:hypothetical protein
LAKGKINFYIAKSSVKSRKILRMKNAAEIKRDRKISFNFVEVSLKSNKKLLI